MENFKGKLGRAVTSCRMCRGVRLPLFLDLGFQPHSDHFLSPEELLTPEFYFPFTVHCCQDCGFLQLGYVVNPQYLYDESYVYESSITRTGREHYYNLARTVGERFGFARGSLAIDIGSNVGVLLSGFRSLGFRILGIDPTVHIAAMANANNIETIPSFFGSAIVPRIISEKGNADVITATNVFMHIDDLDDVLTGVALLLKQRGVFVIEAPYAVDLINNIEYDTMYHQHLGYLSLGPLIPFFKKFGMEVFDAEWIKIHGGTLRVFAAKKGACPVSENVGRFIDREESERIRSLDRLEQFSRQVEEQRRLLTELLRDLRKAGKKIVGLSAPAKGNTLLNYCKIDSSLLEYLTEKSTFKIGKYSPGMHLPIYADEKILEDQPDYAIILAWNFAEEIMQNMEEYKRRGGKFIIPVPKPRIV